MPYSFNVRAGTVSEACEAATAHVQPLHDGDPGATMATVEAIVGLLGDAPEGKVIDLSVSGSTMTEDGVAYSIGLSVSASHQPAAPGGL